MIALYSMVESMSGSPFALGMVFMVRMLPLGIASTVAGIVADRYNRKNLMIASNLIRAVIVLCFLLVDEVSELPLLYVLVALQEIIASVFRPARSASLPNILPAEDLLKANTIMASTWSVILALGAAAGGFAVDLVGVEAVFIIDAVTFLVSTGFIAATIIPFTKPELSKKASVLQQAWTEFKEGLRYLIENRDVGRMVWAKTVWAFGGAGFVYLLALLGEEMWPAAAATGIGILYSVRGIGTGVGPILVQRFVPNQKIWPKLIGWMTIASALSYSTLYFSEWTLFILIPIFLAHGMSGASWVISSVVLQEKAADNVRGRVFAMEWFFLTIVNVFTVFIVSYGLENFDVNLHEMFLLCAGLQIFAAGGWFLLIRNR